MSVKEGERRDSVRVWLDRVEEGEFRLRFSESRGYEVRLYKYVGAVVGLLAF